MGSELVGNSSPVVGSEDTDKSLAPHFTTYTEQFYKVFPFYLSIGMTYDQFWNEDCCLTKYYRQAYELKKKQKNEELWLQGMYIYEALCDVSPVLHAFAKKGTKPLKYPVEPYPLSEKEVNERKERDERHKVEMMKQRLIERSKSKK